MGSFCMCQAQVTAGHEMIPFPIQFYLYGPSSRRVLINHSFSLSPIEGLCESVFCCYAWNSTNEAAHSSTRTHME